MLAAQKDLRIAQRYSLANERVCAVSVDGGEFEVIGNLSYGGFSILVPTGDTQYAEKWPLGKRMTFKLRLLGSDVTGVAMRVYGGVSSYGFSICHDSPALLIFLNSALENMRRGSTLARLSESVRRDRYKEEGWICYHGDGPTDLRIHAKQGTIDEVILSLRNGEDYYDVVYKDSAFVTRRSIDKENVAARMAKSAVIDESVVRQAIGVLCGFSAGKQIPEVNTLFQMLLNLIQV